MRAFGLAFVVVALSGACGGRDHAIQPDGGRLKIDAPTNAAPDAAASAAPEAPAGVAPDTAGGAAPDADAADGASDAAGGAMSDAAPGIAPDAAAGDSMVASVDVPMERDRSDADAGPTKSDASGTDVVGCGPLKACNGKCIAMDACCVDKDCAGSCQRCGAGNACTPIKSAESSTCSGDHLCDENGSCSSRFTVFPIPNGGLAYQIVPGSDGNVWFIESSNNKIARMSPTGVVTDFTVPTANSGPSGLSLGSDGNVWFGESEGSKIGRVSSTGTFAEYQLEQGSFPFIRAILALPGQPWFSSGHLVAFGTSATASTSVTLPGEATADSLALGADGNVWYASRISGSVGRINISNMTVTEFPLPVSSVPPEPHPDYLTRGADGALWFSENSDNQIARIDTNGVVKEFNLPTPKAAPEGTCLGSDGNVWFVEGAGHGLVMLPGGNFGETGGLGRVSPSGQVVELSLPPGLSGLGIAAGPDGNLWIADGPQIIRFRMK